MITTVYGKTHTGETCHFELLGETPVPVGSSAESAVRLSGLDASCLKFSPGEVPGSWHVTPLGEGITVDGMPLPNGRSMPLQHNCQIAAGAWLFHIRRQVDLPKVQGDSVREIPLPKPQSRVNKIVFGREDNSVSAQADSVLRVDLDAQDFSISKEHAVLENRENGWWLRDTSRSGTELNGTSFSQEELIFGDRFTICGYIFEFTGRAIQLIEGWQMGQLLAKGVSVTVGGKGNGKTILHPTDLTIRPGEFVGILGGSGQGKSTLMNALCGIRPATSGEVWLGQIPLHDPRQARRVRIGYVPQDDIVHSELRVRDAIRYSADLRLSLPRHQIEKLVERVGARLGLSEHMEKRVHNLSGGQRKRVSIAIELLSRPTVLFLDEPSSGLDPATEEDLMALLQSLTLTGLTVICTTHVLQRAYLFHRLLFIHGGRLVFAGNADEARAHFLFAGDDSGAAMEALDRTPLERIYSLLAKSPKPAEEWEQEFQQSRGHHPTPTSEEPLDSAQSSADAASRKPPPLSKVHPLKVLRILLRRQFSILVSDPLNVVFLFGQALIIALLIGWVAEDVGLRAFLVIIAAMWFACSNAAQSIVGELPIFQRESVCGLGLATYINSKAVFLSGLTLCQALVLSATVLTIGNLVHPVEFDEDSFNRRMTDRLKDDIELTTMRESTPAFQAEGFEVVGMEEADKPSAEASSAVPDGAAKEENRPLPLYERPIAMSTLRILASWFFLGDNLTYSGARRLTDDRGRAIRDADGEEIVLPGQSVFKVLSVTLGLRMAGIVVVVLVGVFAGLAISALVRNTTQAVMWVPLFLIPQILFGGFVVTLPEMPATARAIATFVPSMAGERVLEVSFLYGSAVPFLSNRTKTPLFLTTTGERETVEWEEDDQTFSQDYDEISRFNTAWQNLALHAELLGQHKQEFSTVPGSSRKIFRDTVERRRDVRYWKGVPYFHLQPAGIALTVLAGWIAAMYVAVLGGLWSKRTRR